MVEFYLKKLCEDVGIILVLLEKNPSLEKESEEWYRKDEVIDYFDISASTYYVWLNKGIIKPCSTAGEKRYLKEDIEKIALGRKRRKRSKSSYS